MSRLLRSLALVAAAVLTALCGFVGVTLPPRTASLAATVPPTIVFGAYHIHTNRSDGSGTPDDVALDASRAGLAFVVLTDHGDATRAPDAPVYRHGVLCIDGVEINTSAGHLVALGIDHAAPYPLAGDARDVLDDVHRLGGWGIVAHPDSPNPDLRWRMWNVPYDGVEWLNADSEWRGKKASVLAGTALRALVRPPEAIASLFARPSRTLQRWDAATEARPIVGLAAVDAHARFDWRPAEPRAATLVARPRYEDMFRALVQAVVLDRPLSGQAADDAARVGAALRGGHTYSSVRAFAQPAVLDFFAMQSGGTTPMGGRLIDMGPMVLHAGVEGVPDANVVVLHDGSVVARGKGKVEVTSPPSPGAYRAEVYYPGFSVPWIVSNPIYADLPTAPPSVVASSVPRAALPIAVDAGWRTENDNASTASIRTDGHGVELTYALGGGPSAGQYAAAVTEVSAAEAFDGMTLVAHADRPTRVSVQVRFLGGQRWRRSVYLDETTRTISFPLEEFEPADPASVLRPTAARIRSVLVVVDTLNTRPGTRGVVTVIGLSLIKAPADNGGPLTSER